MSLFISGLVGPLARGSFGDKLVLVVWPTLTLPNLGEGTGEGGWSVLPVSGFGIRSADRVYMLLVMGRLLR